VVPQEEGTGRRSELGECKNSMVLLSTAAVYKVPSSVNQLRYGARISFGEKPIVGQHGYRPDKVSGFV
jgi:hypothetical protein